MPHPLNEQLLSAWVRMSTAVVNNRIVSELSYNEALVCRLLYEQSESQPDSPLNATRLCQLTGMVKSQMNRTLGALEAKGLVERRRCRQDRRQVEIRFNRSHAAAFSQQHDRILALVDGVIARLGTEQAQQTVETLMRLSAAAEAQLNEERNRL